MESNRRVYLHLDIIKVIALCLMPTCHIFEEALRFELLAPGFPIQNAESIIGFFYCIFPAAFMFCMGATIQFSRHNSPDELIKRGLILIGIFFVLNIFRFTLPSIISIPVTGTTEMFDENLCQFIISDILSLAGLSMIAIGLSKKFNISTPVLLLIAVAMVLIQSFLPSVNFGSSATDEIISGFVGWFIYTSPGYTYFPLMSWFIFPVAGMIYSEMMTSSSSELSFHVRSAVISAVVIIVMLLTSLFGITDYEYVRWAYSDGFFLSAVSALFALALCVFVISIIYCLVHDLKESRFTGIMRTVAREINGIYCIHWILIMWCILTPLYILEIRIGDPFIIIALGLLIFIISYCLSVFCKKFIRKDHSPKHQPDNTAGQQ